MRALVYAVIVAAVAIIVLCWPVCQPLDDEEVRLMNPPISARRQERTLWFKSYEVRGQRWCQCRPWVERKLFF